MPLDLARVRALCFDVDGTLSDSDDDYVRRFSGWIGRVPFVRDPHILARRLVMWLESPGSAIMSLGDALGLDTYLMPLIDWMQRHRPRRRIETLIMPGVVDMLPRLKRCYPMAVVSARNERSTMTFLENCHLLSNFDAVLTALSARHTKPYPDPILLAAKMMGVRPEACLMIGDTSVDIRAAKSAGAQSIGLLCGFGKEPELRRAGADLILPTTADVERVLLGS